MKIHWKYIENTLKKHWKYIESTLKILSNTLKKRTDGAFRLRAGDGLGCSSTSPSLLCSFSSSSSLLLVPGSSLRGSSLPSSSSSSSSSSSGNGSVEEHDAGACFFFAGFAFLGAFLRVPSGFDLRLNKKSFKLFIK